MLKIFRNLRWQLTGWFILLTMSVYIISGVLGWFIFQTSMNEFVDRQLRALTNELIPAVEVENDLPSLKEWAKTDVHIPFRYLPMIQLYNKEGKLIESYGPPGIPTLFSHERRARIDVQDKDFHIRVFSVPLQDERGVLGYLQLQLSLKSVNGAIVNFGTTMALLAPLLLLGSGIAGYLFSSKAARPVEESFSALQQFMADAGHELSTPISIILANAESIDADISDNESITKRLATITRSSERMNNLVSDMTLLAKMEGQYYLQPQNLVDLSKITKEVIADFAEPFKNKEIRLVEGSIESAYVYGDAESLKRMITNLLQNALKYTDAQGEVRMSLETFARQAKLSITDTGIGIAGENLHNLFNRFYRVDPSRSRNAGGSGLGLSIAKAIADAHKGKIEVQSSLGAGTTFSIYLPVK